MIKIIGDAYHLNFKGNMNVIDLCSPMPAAYYFVDVLGLNYKNSVRLL